MEQYINQLFESETDLHRITVFAGRAAMRRQLECVDGDDVLQEALLKICEYSPPAIESYEHFLNVLRSAITHTSGDMRRAQNSQKRAGRQTWESLLSIPVDVPQEEWETRVRRSMADQFYQAAPRQVDFAQAAIHFDRRDPRADWVTSRWYLALPVRHQVEVVITAAYLMGEIDSQTVCDLLGIKRADNVIHRWRKYLQDLGPDALGLTDLKQPKIPVTYMEKE